MQKARKEPSRGCNRVLVSVVVLVESLVKHKPKKSAKEGVCDDLVSSFEDAIRTPVRSNTSSKNQQRNRKRGITRQRANDFVPLVVKPFRNPEKAKSQRNGKQLVIINEKPEHGSVKPFWCFVFWLLISVMLDVSQDEKDNGEQRAERTCNRSQPTKNERTHTKNSNEMVLNPKLGISQISRRSHTSNQLENDGKANECKTENKTNATVEEIQHDDFYFFL